MFSILISNGLSQDMLTPDKISYIPPTVAGAFYPANPAELKTMINNYLNEDKSTIIQQDIYAIVVPHAGYVYSGRVAAKAYKQLIGKKYDAIIIIAPSHQKYFNGASVFKGDAYVTPLGNALVDKELSKEIGSLNSSVKLSMDGHSWSDSSSEHSLEVQIPFLQIVQPDVPIVPIVMGIQNYETCDNLMKSIVSSVKKLNRKVLIVASSDLSHFHSVKEAKKIDKPIPQAFAQFDYFRLAVQFFSKNLEACGGGPIVTAMMTAEQLGGNQAIPIQYATSADSPEGKNNTERVVGYFSGVITKSIEEVSDLKLPYLDENSSKELLEIAKNKVERYARRDTLAEGFGTLIPRPLAEIYTGFVTIKKHGELRACMGHLFPSKQLLLEIEEVAGIAAKDDYRFGPIRENELKELEYEVSVLSRFKKILSVDEIKPGTHGLYIRYKNNSGILLPQVAEERGWSTTTFLENICMKAGLPKDTYKNPEAELYIFKALIIN